MSTSVETSASPQISEPANKKSPDQAIAKLIELKHRAAELKRHANFTMEDIEALAGVAGPIFQEHWRGEYESDNRLDNLIEEVFAIFFSMSFVIEKIDPKLQDLYARTTKVYNALNKMWFENRESYTLENVREQQEELARIEGVQRDGKFADEEGNVPRGQAMLHSLLEKCYRLAHNLLSEFEILEKVDPELKGVYTKLIGIYSTLHKMAIGERNFVTDDVTAEQQELAKIAAYERDGKFYGSHGSIPKGQALIHTLMDRCYKLAHRLLIDCEQRGV